MSATIARVEDSLELSPIQESLLLETLTNENSRVGLWQMVWELPEYLCPRALVLAWRHAVARHPGLRSRVRWREVSSPRLEIVSHATPHTSIWDWSQLTEEDQELVFRRWLATDRRLGLELDRAPLLRVAVISLGTKRWRSVLTLHHVLIDGRSLRYLVQEVLTCYETIRGGEFQPLPPAPSPRLYMDWIKSLDLDLAEAFWREALRDLGQSSPVEIESGERPSSKGQAAAERRDRPHGDRHRFLSTTVSAELEQQARLLGLTLNSLMIAAVTLLLARYSGRLEVVIGVVRTNRSVVAQGEEIVAPLMNSMPFRAVLSAHATTREQLAALRVNWKRMQKADSLSLSRIRELSGVPADARLLETLVAFERSDLNEHLRAIGPNWAQRGFYYVRQPSVPFSFYGYGGRAIKFEAVYDRSRYDDSSAERALAHLENLLLSLVRAPDRPFVEHDLLTAGELHQLRFEAHDVPRAHESPRHVLPGEGINGPTLVSRLLGWAEIQPEAIALDFEDGLWSYRGLLEHAGGGAQLLRGSGLLPEQFVAVALPPSGLRIVALVATLLAGGAYLPLELEDPPERLGLMLSTSRAAMLITERESAQRVAAWLEHLRAQEHPEPRLIWVSELHATDDFRPPSLPLPEQLAYLIFTSGSTGHPKGVAVPHRGAVELVVDSNYMAVAPGDRVGQISSISFDASTFEIWTALANGARLIGLPRQALTDPWLLRTALLARPVSHLLLVTPAFHLMAHSCPDAAAEVTHLMVGGSALEPAASSLVLEQHRSKRFSNLYGPTECSVVATAMPVQGPGGHLRRDTVAIGRSIAHTQAWVVDASGQLAPPGVRGELYLGGSRLARGYVGQPGKTAAQFVPDWLSDRAGGRLYRTGDLARWLAHGGLEFLGRGDDQVKLRGYRIELAEIEGILARHHEVRAAVARVEKSEGGHELLIAWVVAQEPAGDLPDRLETYLRQRLPAYMVPAAIVPLADLPLLPSGKVDRKRLQAHALVGRRYQPPSDEIELALAEIWKEVLKAPVVGRLDNFFDLGGHSLLATRAIIRTRERFDVELPLRTLLESTHLADLAGAVRSLLGTRGERTGLVRRHAISAPLSPAQQRLWFLYELFPQSASYNIARLWRIKGALNAARFEASWRLLITRQETLRCRIRTDAGGPRQEIQAALDRVTSWIDFGALSAGDRAPKARRLAKVGALRPFALGGEPPRRVSLLRLSGEESWLLLLLHHLVADADSLSLLLGELETVYSAKTTGENPDSKLPPLPIQYSDYAIWQHQRLLVEPLLDQLHFWRQSLEGAVALELPLDRPRPALRRFSGQRLLIPLGADTQRLGVLARKGGGTTFMAALTVFYMLLKRTTGQRDLVVGTPFSGRSEPGLESLVGFFINTLVLRLELPRSSSFTTLFERVKTLALQAFSHQDLPFERVVEELGLTRDLSRMPLVDVIFLAHETSDEVTSFAGLGWESLKLLPETSRFDLETQLAPGPSGPELALTYDTDLFDATTIERFGRAYTRFLAAVLDAPESTLEAITMLSRQEHHQLLVEVNEPAADGAGTDATTVEAAFWAQANLRPDSIALLEGNEATSYARLAELAASLAAELRARGVSAEVPVVLALERSADLVVSILATMLAEGFYCPLDPQLPPARFGLLLQRLGAPVVVVRPQHRAAMAELLDAADVTPRPCFLDPRTTSIAAPTFRAVAPRPRSGEYLAYVMFTSGSTGEPKGVAVPHRGILRLVAEGNFARFGPEEVFFFYSQPAFDASTFELWGALLKGGRVVIPNLARPSLAELAEFIERQRVSTLWLTAGLFHQMVDFGLERLSAVRQLLAGGDVLSPHHVDRVLRHLPGTVMINGYGPTENTTFTTCHGMHRPLGGVSSVPLGRPLNSTSMRVVDDELQPVPLGVPGEVLTGGAGLARGYWRQPALTATRFVPALGLGPPGSRLYRTGDLARWQPDGALMFLGRRDEQVKLRGFRLELGEVVAALEAHEAVRSAAALVRVVGGERRLVAYLVPEDPDASFAPPALRDWLGKRLPDYAMPAAFVVLPELPLTPNGKLDRRLLPAPGEDGDDAGLDAGQTPTERSLAELFASLLGRKQVGRRQSFFELGGHSLLVTRLVAQLAQQHGLRLPMQQVFLTPTVAELAAALDALARSHLSSAVPLAPGPETVRQPLAPAQLRLWLEDRLNPGSWVYNVPLVLTLAGPLEVRRLGAAIHAVVSRHQPLRTLYEPGVEDQQPTQVLRKAAPVPLPVIDLGPLSRHSQTASRARLLCAGGRRPFDLSRRVLRTALLRSRPEDHHLLFAVHHIAFDGWSTGILLAELGELYSRLARDPRAELPPLPVSYGDFVRWQLELAESPELDTMLETARRELTGLPRVELPADFAPRLMRDRGGAQHRSRLPSELAAGIERLARSLGTTPLVVCLAAFAALISRLSSAAEVVLGTPVSGRSEPSLYGLIGFFVNPVVLRLPVSPRDTAGYFLETVKNRVLSAMSRQEIPFERLVRELGGPVREAGRNPLFEVVFAYDETTTTETTSEHLQLSVGGVELGLAKFDLMCLLEQHPGGWSVVFDYRRDLFHATTVARWQHSYLRLLEGLVSARETRLDSLPFFRAAERHQLDREWNHTAGNYPRDAALHELFFHRAELGPDRVALVDNEQSITYGVLARRARARARWLLTLGLGAEEPVALLLERSLELVESILAVLAAGGFYVPLDRGLPPARLAKTLADLGARLLLGDRAALAEVKGAKEEGIETGALRELALHAVEDAPPVEGFEAEAGFEAPRGPVASTGGSRLAYVMYTSGSTGEPKGVAVPHRGVVRLVLGGESARLCCAFGADQTWLLLAPTSFDAATLELWGALLHGARLVVYRTARPPLSELAELIRRHRITSLWLTAGLFHLMVEQQLEALGELDQLLAGGDALSPPRVSRLLREASPVALTNGYGPTENTTFTTCHTFGSQPLEHDLTPIGRPIAHSTVMLLDRRLRPVPWGAVGELVTGGDGLARGYWRRPAATAERFIPDPTGAAAGARLYRTGDLARFDSRGELHFLGRLDHQVKIRGFRLELAAVEAAIERHPDVLYAVASARAGGSGGKTLVAYVVPKPSACPFSLSALNSWLSRDLPQQALPSALVVLDRVPLTAQGKVDRKALPEPVLLGEASSAVSPATAETDGPLAALICQLAAEVLGLPAVSSRESFFAVGGHSLAAIRLQGLLAKSLGVDVPLNLLFEAAHLGSLASQVASLVAGGPSHRERPPLGPRSGEAPLSFAQERLWFLDRLAPASSLYNLPLRLDLAGRLVPPALAAALAASAARHETLRSSFGETKGQPRLDFAAAVELKLSVVDLSAAGAGEPVGRLAGYFARLPFRLDRAPLARALLLRSSATRHSFVWVQHHIISDGWSLDRLGLELAHEYHDQLEGRPSGTPPPSVQYGDYALWQRQWLNGELLERQLGFWRRALAGVPVLELPADRPRPAVKTYRGDVVRRQLPPALLTALDRAAQEHTATRFLLLLAAVEAWVHRLSGATSFAVGTMVANRSEAALAETQGLVANTLVLQAEVAAQQAIHELVQLARRRVLEAFAHPDLPFERLVLELEPERALSHTPIFQLMVVERRPPAGRELEAWRLGGLHCAAAELSIGSAKFDLGVALVSTSEGTASLAVEYSSDLFDRATAQRFASQIECVLASVSANSQARVSDLVWLTAAEAHQLSFEMQAEELGHRGETRLEQLFFAQAGATPERVAVRSAEEVHSYAELAARARGLAARLVVAGVGPERPVGVLLERTPRLVEALLAVLTAGAPYLPLDPAYPSERLRFMLEDAGAELCLTHERLTPLLAGLPVRPWLFTHSDPAGAPPNLPSTAAALASPTSLAYLIYTSGSSGRPKGVMIEHGSALALQVWARRLYSDEELSAVLASTSVCFDLSIFELFAPLSWGGSVVLVEQVLALCDGSVSGAPSLLNTVPSAMAELLRLGAVPSSIRTVNLAGEPLKAELARGVLNLPQRPTLYNCYGPSEDTTYSTFSRVAGHGAPSIGGPLPGTRGYIVDRHLGLLPLGAAGELVLAGLGLARGYLGRPALTAERFVPDPFGVSPGGRLYHTGDWVRRLAHGELDFLGRRDHQVKLRGYRIELEEIETRLLALPGVREVVVVTRPDAAGEPQLVAYLAPEQNHEQEEALRVALAAQLPAYMLPSLLVTLAELPKTASGKIDRRALPDPEYPSLEASTAAELSPQEELVAAAFAEVLGLPAVAPEVSFFALGGHSLQATRLVARLSEVLGTAVPLSSLFESPSVRRLTAYLASLRPGAASADPPLLPVPQRPAELPLSFAQERFWFLDRLEPGSPTYHVPAVLELAGELDGAALDGALADLIRRHEVLRTRFALTSSGPRQEILLPAPPRRGRIDLSALRDASAPTAEGLARSFCRRPFDLERETPFRFALLRLGATSHQLLLLLHHVAADLGSWVVLCRDLAHLYRRRRGEPGAREDLPALPLQVVDHAWWQRRALSSGAFEPDFAFWCQELADLPALELPTDRPRPPYAPKGGGRCLLPLPTGLAQRLEAASRRLGATPFLLSATTFAVFLALTSGQRRFALGVPVAGRRHPELRQLIGCFLNTLTLRVTPSRRLSFAAAVGELRSTWLKALDHQTVPFEGLVAHLAPARDLGAPPFFRVLINYHDETPEAAWGEVEARFRPLDTATAKLDLALALGRSTTRRGELVASLTYAADLFDSSTIQRWARSLCHLLELLMASPDTPLDALPLLSPSERQQLLEWRQTAALARPEPIDRWFERSVDRGPDDEALLAVDGRGWVERLSYAELDARSSRLARFLRLKGCGPERVVGLSLKRCAELIVALLAVVKAGGAYLALDPAQPLARQAALLSDAKAMALLTRGPFEADLDLAVAVLDLKALAAEVSQLPGTRLELELPVERALYLLYTSGSTGRPKGVVVEHRQLAAYVEAVSTRLELPAGTSFATVSTVAADLGNTAVFPALLGHGRLVLVAEELAMDPEGFSAYAGREPFDALKVTPTHLGALLGARRPANLLPTRQLVLGGETAAATLLAELRRLRPNLEIVNHYGPTETTVGVLAERFRPGALLEAPLPLGRPLAHARLRVLDRDGFAVPVGATGELCFAGPAVTRGYLGRPATTALVFRPDADGEEPGDRCYHTGDLGRLRADGRVELLGRADAQLKVRGFRIEPGEIETLLGRDGSIRMAAVVPVGSDRLVAYLVRSPGVKLDLEALRQRLRRELPTPMVPSEWVELDSLPLTANGKVDRQLLAQRSRQAPATAARATAPSPTDFIHRLSAIWRHLLNLDQMAPDDNFFDLGGHSLLLMQLQRRLAEELGATVRIVDLFAHPTVATLAAHLGGATPLEAKVTIDTAADDSKAIAIIGWSGRFPGAPDIPALWRNLRDGVESIERWDQPGMPPPAELAATSNYVPARGMLAGIELFDAALFGFRPREAAVTDPQQRVFLECAWEALEDAGYDPQRFPGEIGIFAGAGRNTYFLNHIFKNPSLGAEAHSLEARVGNDKDFLVTRVAYKLQLKGPAVAIQTACSTSLVAVHYACRSLLDDECEMALAGGVRIGLPQDVGYLYQEGGIASQDGHCRAFDIDARGIVPGNGAGVVVLKRLSRALADGDAIHGVILASAVNNDGGIKVGYSAPSVEGQARVIRRALKAAGIPPASIGYVEAHGTGTALGDPIEIAALKQAFGDHGQGEPPCLVGSLKTNVGHLDTAAGVAGLIKATLAVGHGEVPPSLHFKKAHPELGLESSRFVIPTALTPWPVPANGRRRAAVSSFGIGGTNAHMLVEEPPPRAPSFESRRPALLLLSGANPSAVAASAERLATWLGESAGVELADVAHTLREGRRRLPSRRAVVASTVSAAARALTEPMSFASGRALAAPSVVYLFPGQGAQHVGMARELYGIEPRFEAELGQLTSALEPLLGFDLLPLLLEEHESAELATQLADTRLAQPALFVVELALARLWQSWGVPATAMLGHSVGEYVAATLAGVFDWRDALAAVVRRGELMAGQPRGAMLSVALQPSELEALLAASPHLSLDIAAINAAASVVVSGPEVDIELLKAELVTAGVSCRPLAVSHGFHSRAMRGAVAPFRAWLEQLELRPPQRPFVSSSTGAWITPQQATSPSYWAEHLATPVRFATGLATLLTEPQRVLLQVGPGRSLLGHARRQAGELDAEHRPVLVASMAGAPGGESRSPQIYHALSELWIAGVEPDWSAVLSDETRLRLHLPTYPFQRQRFWVEPVQTAAASGLDVPLPPASAQLSTPELSTAEGSERPYLAPTDETECHLAALWEELFGIRPIGSSDNFFELGGDSLLATRIAARVQEDLGVEISPAALLRLPRLAEMAAEVRSAQNRKRAGGLSEWLAHLERESSATRPASPEQPPGGAVR